MPLRNISEICSEETSLIFKASDLAFLAIITLEIIIVFEGLFLGVIAKGILVFLSNFDAFWSIMHLAFAVGTQTFVSEATFRRYVN
jgi:hypothetical protein